MLPVYVAKCGVKRHYLASCSSGLAKLEISIYFCFIKYLFLFCQELICWAAENQKFEISSPLTLPSYYEDDPGTCCAQSIKLLRAQDQSVLASSKKRKFFSYLVILLPGPFLITFKHFSSSVQVWGFVWKFANLHSGGDQGRFLLMLKFLYVYILDFYTIKMKQRRVVWICTIQTWRGK